MEKEMAGWRVSPGMSQGDGGWDMEVMPGQGSNMTKGVQEGSRDPLARRTEASKERPEHGL